MRRILAASLLLSPLFLTAAAVASPAPTDASASTATRAISTGVTSPKVIEATSVNLPSASANWFPNDAEVVLQLNLDETGKVQDAQIVKSPNSQLDAPVLEAVRRFRFSPAILDKQAIPVGMTLTVQLQH